MDPGSPRAVPNGLTLLVGGARSGKSSLAVELGRAHAMGRIDREGVTFVATAQALDDDMATRIARHRHERPGWATVEEPIELVAALDTVPPDHLVIIDCLTLWVSNLLLAEASAADVLERAQRAAATAVARHAPTVAVSNEVGLGVHPATELGRQYQDLLGRVNQVWARASSRTLLLVAGRATELRDPWEILEAST